MFEGLITVAQQVGILFALMAIGFACNKTRLLTETSIKGMVNVLILIVTPCLIVHSFQEHEFRSDLLVGLGWAFAFSVLSPALGMIASYLLIRKDDVSQRSVLRCSMVFSNAGFMGIPLEYALLGSDGVFYGVAYVVVFNLLFWSWGLVTFCGSLKDVRIRTLFLNPGSVGVVTINMPRIAYLAKTEEEFYRRLDRMMDIAARSLKTKRTVITKLLDAGLYPYTKYYLGTFENHFSTIGLVGMNEACLNARWLRKDLTNPEAQEFTKAVLNHMRERLSDYQEKYGDLYNLEATPAESTSYRLAKHDRARYPEIITANMNGTPYYTNSSHLPVGYTEDIFSALDIQDDLQTLYTSGTVFHAFLGEKLPDWRAAADLVRKIAENYKLPYYTMSPTYSVCHDHGYITGEHFTCPECGKDTEVWSRITGYYRPVQNWNDGKVQEFNDRKEYNIGHSHFTGGIHRHEAGCCCGDTVAHGMQPEEVGAVSAVRTAQLFTRTTCPNCRVAEKLLDKAGFAYENLTAEEHPELCREYGIQGAPTLVLSDGVHFEKYYGVAEIKKLLAETLQKAE